MTRERIEAARAQLAAAASAADDEGGSEPTADNPLASAALAAKVWGVLAYWSQAREQSLRGVFERWTCAVGMAADEGAGGSGVGGAAEEPQGMWSPGRTGSKGSLLEQLAVAGLVKDRPQPRREAADRPHAP